MEQLLPARESDLEACYDIIQMGKAFQKNQGFSQWTDDYPSLDIIRQDIQAQKGYVLRIRGAIAGYMFIDFDGDPAYDHIQGAWHSPEPYAVIHRMAFHKDSIGKGLSQLAFRLAEDLCRAKGMRAIRMDTDFPNKRMQHVMVKYGFSPCGTIVFQDGDKLAYDKVL